MAAAVVNAVLEKVVAACVAGAVVVDVCELGDKLLIEGTNGLFRKDKDIKKGIAFPTCVSPNNIICHYSPLKSDPQITLKNGDLVSIDLGAHLDGWIAVAAHTFVIGASVDNPVTGKAADAILAAHDAAEAALRMVVPTKENYAVTDAIQRVAKCYGCSPVEGMLSHQLKQHVIDGEKAVIQNPSEAHRKDHKSCEFDVHEVYAIDVIVSSGDGKGRDCDHQTRVFKRRLDTIYQLKMKASRQLFSEVDKKCAAMPFSLRPFDEDKSLKAKFGINELRTHQLVEAFNVLAERDDHFVAQFKFTVLLMPNGPMKITGLPFNADLYKSEHTVTDPEMKELLASSVSKSKNKKKKKKAEKQAQEQAMNTS